MGLLEAYKSQEEQLKVHKEKLYKAKCYEAYNISQQIKKLSIRFGQQNSEEELSRILGLYWII